MNTNELIAYNSSFKWHSLETYVHVYGTPIRKYLKNYPNIVDYKSCHYISIASVCFTAT